MTSDQLLPAKLCTILFFASITTGSLADSRASGSRCCPSDTAANRSPSLGGGNDAHMRCFFMIDPLGHPRPTDTTRQDETEEARLELGACWTSGGRRAEALHLVGHNSKGLLFLVQCNPNPSLDPTLTLEPSPRHQFHTKSQRNEPSAVLDKASPDLVFHQHQDLELSAGSGLCVRKLPST